MNHEDLLSFINDSDRKLNHDEEIKKTVLHNIGLYLQINASVEIFSNNFFDLDFRKDYWWKPEIRMIGSYYIDNFKDDFYPFTSSYSIWMDEWIYGESSLDVQTFQMVRNASKS